MVSIPTHATGPSWYARRLQAVVLLSRSPRIRWSLALLPSILAAIYFLGIASDQYESEARFVVRSASAPEMTGALSFLVQLGIARSQDDSYIVQDFIGSRDAMKQLQARLPLDRIYGSSNADFLARWPSLLYGAEDEQLYKYLQTMISAVHFDRTGITTLRVRAFDGASAKAIAEAILQMSEELVNRLNARLLTDAVAASTANVAQAEERLIAAQTRLTEFQNQELMVDPARNAVALADLIARLSSELGVVQSQIAEMKGGPAGSPQLGPLQRKATAFQNQIAQERLRIANSHDGLAVRIAAYERLNLEREFARRMLASAEAELVRSRNEAARQMLYLEQIVSPNLPDSALYPKRLKLVVTTIAANLILILVAWLVIAGIQEHSHSGSG